MQNNAGRKLEFDKIKEKLCTYTVTPLGTQLASDILPRHDPELIEALQKETSEAVKVINSGKLKIASCKDILLYLKRARKGILLPPGDIRDVGNFLRTVNTLRPSFFNEDGMQDLFPQLCHRMNRLSALPKVVSEVDSAVSAHGEVKDQASPVLFSLKRQEKTVQEKIRKTLDSYVQSPNYGKYLQDRIITVRQNRYVLPLKQEFRQHIPGVVHDQSSSGMTLFVEPFPVLELNNKLREIHGKIEEEIEKILRKLTYLIHGFETEIEENYYLYGELDYILARGHLSRSYKGAEPAIERSGIINIRQGRHPLIAENEVVPIDVHIGNEFKTLVITGPNTGGKTVTLKTIGLFSLMAQSGLHLPADPGTVMGVFQSVWADIGDEQNIEQSLSTFSGHMSNIIRFIHSLERQEGLTLILLDELGSGTDPQEGSALAMAILDHLHLFNTRTVATTHINDLKVFAHIREGMENASMEFDPNSLAPTFRLLIGIPGQSNALVIAKKLGLPESLVSKARSFMKKEFLDLEQAVSGLVAERKKLSVDTRSVEAKKKALEERLQEVDIKLLEIDNKKKQYLSNARNEARTIVDEARKKAGEALKRIKQAEKEKDKKAYTSLVEQSRRELKEMQDQIHTDPEREYAENEGFNPVKLEDIQQGDLVYIKSLRTYGEVVRVQSANDIQVQAGALKINTNVDDLGVHAYGKENKTVSKKSEGSLFWEKSATTKPQIDLRGLTLEEALSQLEKYLDDALLAGLDSVEIIHGKGTGRLRKGIQDYLESWRYVDHYRLGEEGEGGSGVTIVTFQKDVSR